jgi:hypothetical protein
VVKLEPDRLEGLMSPGRGSTRAMWVDRANPKWRAVYNSLPHDEIWRTTSELFVLAQKSGLVRLGDDMGGLISSMRKHNLAESQPAVKGLRHRLVSQPIVSPRPRDLVHWAYRPCFSPIEESKFVTDRNVSEIGLYGTSRTGIIH